MTSDPSITPSVRVAIDVAKLTHQVLLELPNGKRRVIRVASRNSVTRQCPLCADIFYPHTCSQRALRSG